MFENRQAILADSSLCETQHGGKRFLINAGTRTSPRFDFASHPEVVGFFRITGGFTVETDDPDEAARAFERGAEWVRTGEGP